ncbi:3-hydroxyacyl-CoA dehydrogenase family protein [Paracraurococcus ruber]|uniref:3-hydroxyacyl-CoA dehydrogenase n=1 Tax=Paracraurococcus ruber TaxID=77675 RepID=A0ABS1CSW6_9PROT|nr:3-hydroxyacyl-CoA dehydrogenase NAD-binding domain-containing protein [Paracraurococcus ruber]MBK1657092.1 3-hydroxyacyl-CoA dehydrogenase [Paracraurococcus ruber]TDG33391.1 3-hydroxyacyl-CoA dehydrogenase [Paracraurococcus ruber]
MPPDPVKGHAAIIGFGLMGCDIAAIFLAGGWRVTAVEPARAAWPARLDRVALSLSQLGAAPARVEALDLVAALEDVGFADADVVVEAVPERLDLKRQVFAALDRLVPPGVPVASNASGFRITDIAGDCATRERMANLHFFLPAHLVPGVEVVKGEHTADAACERLAAIMESLGRVAIRVARDVPGFLANRIQHAMVREAFNAIDEGLASPEDVDKAVRFTFGMRIMGAGPILQKELAGLETQLAAQATIYPSLCNRAEPGPTITRLVAEGKLGAKTGEGFWQWTPESTAAAREKYERMLLAALELLRREP